jgi:hypothetical protein
MGQGVIYITYLEFLHKEHLSIHLHVYPFIYLYLHPYRLMDAYYILWVLTQYYITYFVAYIILLIPLQLWLSPVSF